MKIVLAYLHWLLFGLGVLLLLIHFFAHLESNLPLIAALLFEIVGIALFVIRIKKSK